MGSLADVINSAVRTADKVFAKNGLQVVVYHSRVLRRDADDTVIRDDNGQPSHDSETVRRAILEPSSRVTHSATGDELVSKHKLTFLSPGLSVDVLDKLWLENGHYRPIVDVTRVELGTGPALTTVYLG